MCFNILWGNAWLRDLSCFLFFFGLYERCHHSRSKVKYGPCKKVFWRSVLQPTRNECIKSAEWAALNAEALMRWPSWHEHLPQCRISTHEFHFCHFCGWNVPSPLSSLTWHYIPSSPSPCRWLTKSSIPDWHQTVVESHSYVPCAATDGRAHNFLFVRPQNIWHWFRICTKTGVQTNYTCAFSLTLQNRIIWRQVTKRKIDFCTKIELSVFVTIV